MTSVFASRRARLVMLLVITTAAITVLAFRAAGASVAYYITPAEYLAGPTYEGSRVSVAGRVAPDTIVTRAGRPIAFDIVGDQDDRIHVSYEDGRELPNLFGPYTLVIAQGRGVPGGVVADSVIVKHENEFFADTPPSDSISSHFVPSATPAP